MFIWPSTATFFSPSAFGYTVGLSTPESESVPDFYDMWSLVPAYFCSSSTQLPLKPLLALR